MPLSEAAPLGSAVLARDNTAPERISRGAQRAETPLSPTPQEGTPSPTLSVSAGVIDLPRLVLEIRDPSSRAVSAGCHGDGKRGHLPSLSPWWDKTVPRQQIPPGGGLGLVVPPGTHLGGASPILCPTISHKPGLSAGWSCGSWGGEGRRCWGEPCGFSPFPFVSFPCFSLLLSCPSQACGWTSSSPIRCASVVAGGDWALQSCGGGPGR